MSRIDHLTPADRARHLRNPEGADGIAVAEYLNASNQEGNIQTVDLLGLQPGHRVLEIGFGNGRIARDVVSRAADIQYSGIDISETLLTEASRWNSSLIRCKARFSLMSSFV